MIRRHHWRFLAAILWVAGGGWADPARADDFQVNAYTTGNQFRSSVAMDADGDFVVVWHSQGSAGNDTSLLSIQGRRYAADGTAAGGQFQVNTYTTGNQRRPRVAMDAGGDFVVVWDSEGSAGTDTDARSVQGRRYAADGTPAGVQFQINTYTTSFQRLPAVALDADGDFVVVWTSSYQGIRGRRYAADGTALGGEFQVESYTTGFGDVASVAMDADGDFVVGWQSSQSPGTDSSLESVQARRFAADGSALGDQFQVNTYTTSYQRFASVAMAAGGDFVVVWDSEGSAGTSAYRIHAQLYAADGSPEGGELVVSPGPGGDQLRPQVAVDADGDFVVVWHSADSSSFGIEGRRFAAGGSGLGDEFQVNSYVTSTQYRAAVAIDAFGGFAAVWESDGSAGSDSDGFSVQGGLFPSLPIFVDGFESGDVSAWSSTVP